MRLTDGTGPAAPADEAARRMKREILVLQQQMAFLKSHEAARRAGKAAMDSVGERFEAIRTAQADRSNVLTVKELCRLAGVSRSGYYNWIRSQRTRELRAEWDRTAFAQILEAYRFRGYAKGVRGIHMQLAHMGIRRGLRTKSWTK